MEQELIHNLGQNPEWQQRMEGYISHLLTLLSEEIRTKLDLTPDSLNLLEAWLFDRYGTFVDFGEEEEISLIAGVFFYIGETYRGSLGGHWSGYDKEFDFDVIVLEQLYLEGFEKYNYEFIHIGDRIWEALQKPYAENRTLSSDLKGLMGI